MVTKCRPDVNVANLAHVILTLLSIRFEDRIHCTLYYKLKNIPGHRIYNGSASNMYLSFILQGFIYVFENLHTF